MQSAGRAAQVAAGAPETPRHFIDRQHSSCDDGAVTAACQRPASVLSAHASTHTRTRAAWTSQHMGSQDLGTSFVELNALPASADQDAVEDQVRPGTTTLGASSAGDSILIGHVLARTANIGGCVCPIGACGVLLALLCTSIAVTVWSTSVAFNIGEDATPDIDGFVPRGTTIGDRDNTFSLLIGGCESSGLTNSPGATCCAALSSQTACAAAEACSWDADTCADAASSDSCGAAASTQQAPALAGGLSTATGPASTYAPPAASGAGQGPRGVPAAGSVNASLPSADIFCDACSRRVQIVYAPRAGNNMLTAETIRAACAYEARYQVPGHQAISAAVHHAEHHAVLAQCIDWCGLWLCQVEGHCETAGNGAACCGAWSIGKVLAHAVGNAGGCDALTDADVTQALQLVMDCKDTCVDDPTGWLSSLPISGADCGTVLGLPAGEPRHATAAQRYSVSRPPAPLRVSQPTVWLPCPACSDLRD